MKVENRKGKEKLHQSGARDRNALDRNSRCPDVWNFQSSSYHGIFVAFFGGFFSINILL